MNGKVDPNDPRPPYHQIADDLRRQIADGTMAAGQRLPSIRELAAGYSVAPMTVHQAVRVLRDERLVRSVQGRGVYARARSRVVATDDPIETHAALIAAADDWPALVVDLLMLHAPRFDPEFETWECAGDDFLGTMGDPPSWPCRTVVDIARHLGVDGVVDRNEAFALLDAQYKQHARDIATFGWDA